MPLAALDAAERSGRRRHGGRGRHRARPARLLRLFLVAQLVALAVVAVRMTPAGQRVLEAAFGVTVIQAPKTFEATAVDIDRVLVLGDSLSNLGDEAISLRFDDVDLKIDARNGRTMGEGRERAATVHAGVRYDAVVLALGTNDVELDRTATAGGLRGILATFTDVPCVLLTTVQPTLYEDTEDARRFSEGAEAVNELLRTAAASDPRVHVVDFGAVAAANPQFHDGMIDLVHLNAEGSIALATEMRTTYDAACVAG